MMHEFLHIAKLLNTKLDITPLLYGSLGLEKRLDINLNADDIDVLIPQIYLNEQWQNLFALMADNGYSLVDLHEHTFQKHGIKVAFANIESLPTFANVDITKISKIIEHGAAYHLLELPDYLKVYTASSKDGYRKNIKNKQDQEKIDLIKCALDNERL